MARKKSYDSEDEVDALKKENSQLKSTIRALEKALKKLSRGKSRLEDLEVMFKELSSEVDSMPKEPASVPCPSCSKGKIKITKLGAKTLESCNSCNHRKVK